MQKDTITADNISFTYKSEKKIAKAWEDLSLHINSGEVTSILGVSGVGKTTLLRILSGLNKPDSGQVLINQTPITQPQSPIFFVFQDYHSTILPWLNVRQNILLGDHKSGHTTSEPELEKVISLLFKEFENEKTDFLKKFPQNLSGGQRQRIQIARALVSRARFIFFDEPDSAVDIQVKMEIRSILQDLAYEENIGVVMVTHDLDNAIALSKHIYVLVKEGLYQYTVSDYIDPTDPYSSQHFREMLLRHFKTNSN